MDYTARENELKIKVADALKPDFAMKPEADGRDLVHGERIRADFLAWPLSATVAAGFSEMCIPIEVKYLEDDDIGKLAEVCWQAITYQQSIFFGRAGKMLRPMFTLIYADGDFNKDTRNEYAQAWRWAGRLLQRANVGFLDVMTGYYDWRFSFGGGKYASKSRGVIEMGNVENIGIKIYVGNVAEGRGLTTRYIERTELDKWFNRTPDGGNQ